MCTKFHAREVDEYGKILNALKQKLYAWIANVSSIYCFLETSFQHN